MSILLVGGFTLLGLGRKRGKLALGDFNVFDDDAHLCNDVGTQ